MIKAYKYRIYPNQEQAELINKHFGCSRFVYNLALETKKNAWKSHNMNLSAYDLHRQLPELKKEYGWLQEVSAQSLQYSIVNLEKSFKGFFRGSGYPKFKSKYQKQSFSNAQGTSIDFNKQLLSILKIKNIPIVLSRKFKGKIKTVTISKAPTGKYFASILVDNEKELPKKPKIKPATTIGIDLGLKHFIITSDGIKVDNPKYLKESLQRLKVLQRKASKKVKGSNNRKKANLRVAIHHEKITNRRLDFIHKVTSRLVSENQADTFVIEDLNVKGMMSNHKLAQAIGDVSWAKFKGILQYKCDWYGKNLVFINRFAPSSKTCSKCGCKKKKLSLSERTYNCENCGNVIDRDVNAAINIKNFGLNSGAGCSVEPVELLPLGRAMKQEIKPISL